MNVLRILCFNIHGGFDMKGHRDLARVNDLMDSLDIDIGVFQEMETRPFRGGTANDIDILAGKDRSYHLPGPTLKEDKGWYGNLLVSRYPITRAIVHDLETKPSLEPRNAVDALIETPHGNFRIIGTHLSLSPFERWSEVRNLIALMEDVESEAEHPVLLMGDMNEWRWRAKLLRHLNELMHPAPCGKTFPSNYPLLRLDRVWYDDASLDISARVIRDRASLSDHLPILVEIRL